MHKLWYFVIELFLISSALAVAFKHIERRGIIKSSNWLSTISRWIDCGHINKVLPTNIITFINLRWMGKMKKVVIESTPKLEQLHFTHIMNSDFVYRNINHALSLRANCVHESEKFVCIISMTSSFMAHKYARVRYVQTWNFKTNLSFLSECVCVRWNMWLSQSLCFQVTHTHTALHSQP